MSRIDDVTRVAAALRLPAGLAIRPWTDADFPTIQALSTAEGWTTPRDRPAAALQAWRSSWPALVAVSDETMIGFVRTVSDGAVTTYVAEVLVAPDWRGKGIASALLDATQRLCPGTRLDLLPSESSRGFYQHQRFRPFPGFRRSWGELAE
jgi:GNAT superfamily N-acetyltransferase